MGQDDEEIQIGEDAYYAFLEDLRSTLDLARTAVIERLPDRQGLTWEQGYTAGLFLRCLGLYESCSDLIQQGHSEAALIVGRSLLSDALRLRYFALRPSTVKPNVVKWLRQSLRQEAGLWQEGLSAGVDNSKARKEEAEADLRHLEEFSASVPRSKGRLPEEKDMAKAVGDPGWYWTIRLCSNLVHTTQMSMGRLAWYREGVLNTGTFVDPINLAFAASLFTDALFASAEATGRLLDWEGALPEKKRVEVEAEISRVSAKAASLSGELS